MIAMTKPQDVEWIMQEAYCFCSRFHDYLVEVEGDVETANETRDFDQCSSLIHLIMVETDFDRHALFFEQNKDYVNE